MTDDVPNWKAEPLPLRLLTCVSMLLIHGIIPDNVGDKAKARIVRRFRSSPASADAPKETKP